jgi:hypothetical protein
MGSAGAQTWTSRGELRVMIRSRDKRNRQHRHRMRRAAPRDQRDEPLRVLVRVLARQAARERFEREVAAARAIQPEVTLH